MSLKDALQPARHPAKILTLDIETSPNVADVWRLFGEQHISLSQLREVSSVMCFAAKWLGKDRVMFWSVHHHSREEMVQAAWDLLNEADILVTYNGASFDVKHLQREMLLLGMTPPAPWKDVDLLRVVRSNFKMASNKLDHVAEQLGVGSKVKHEGHALWTACLAGDDKAWARMKRYCIGDVRLTEQVYDVLGAWIKNHPHAGLHNGEERSCFRCGSTDLKQDGFARTALTMYARLRCEKCGSWSRLNHRKGNVIARGIQ